ncbi:unnamed protein product [Staurois parvus]|uniref:Uncharacterized protein n=1 Tax=Staurois parvus TaxID=386267 RepID=A0ABN9ACI3_9NEOB|nr:unnamed protein product [Staurois parvus]
MGPRTDSSCCCQARNCPWAPVLASSCCCQVQSVSWVPVRASHCCCLHRHTLPCATFRSPHTLLVVSIFVIGCCMASHCAASTPHCGSTLWFWPRDCPNE